MRPIINYSEELRPLGEMKLIYPKLRATIDHLRVHIVFITLSLTKQLPFGIAKLQRTGNDLSLGEIWGIIRSYPDVFSCTQCTHGNKKNTPEAMAFNRTEQRCFLRCPAQKPGLNCPTISEGLHLTACKRKRFETFQS